MNDLIQRIVNAMIRQEGMPKDYPNPGNLRAAPWLKTPAIEKGFWSPFTRAEGIAGLAHVLALHIAQGNTLADFIAGHPGIYAGFAPGSDHNDPETYIKDVKLWAGIEDENVPMMNYIEEENETKTT